MRIEHLCTINLLNLRVFLDIIRIGQPFWKWLSLHNFFKTIWMKTSSWESSRCAYTLVQVYLMGHALCRRPMTIAHCLKTWDSLHCWDQILQLWYPNLSFGKPGASTLISWWSLGRSCGSWEHKEGHSRVQASIFLILNGFRVLILWTFRVPWRLAWNLMPLQGYPVALPDPGNTPGGW